MNARWNALQPNPRTAPSPRIEMCTHAAWVLTAHGESRCRGSKHLKLCVSFVVLQCLARLRLGWHDLQIRVGRVKAKVPRDQRLCRLCSTVGAPFVEYRSGNSCVEDLKHFVLECPAYRHVRARYSDVFGRVPALCTDMYAIFDCEQQDQLAHALYTMTKLREDCLSRPQGADIDIGILQLAVEEDVELTRIGT